MSLRSRLTCLLAAAVLVTPLLPATAAPPRMACASVSNLKTNASPTARHRGRCATAELAARQRPPRHHQTRYEIQSPRPAAKTEPARHAWDSGVVRSDRSVDVEYAGPALTPYKEYFWTVRVWDDTVRASGVRPATFETAH